MNLDRYKKDLSSLSERGNKLLLSIMVNLKRPEVETLDKDERNNLPDFRLKFQPWYSEALACVTQLPPDRREDFEGYYKPDRTRRHITYANYTISDYLKGVSIEGDPIGQEAILPFYQQLQILAAVAHRFESSLFDIRALVQADLFDNELDAADEINKKGFQRGAGAIAGVVLEEHLGEICSNHKLRLPTNSTISRLNDALKAAEVIDQPTWRSIQHLGDLRNLCDHKKGADPTSAQMQELIAGTRKVTKTVF
jgi:hypothetical protein